MRKRARWGRPGDRPGPLRRLDEVTYLRFASVYRGFESAADFEHEIALLRMERRTPTDEWLPRQLSGVEVVVSAPTRGPEKKELKMDLSDAVQLVLCLVTEHPGAAVELGRWLVSGVSRWWSWRCGAGDAAQGDSTEFTHDEET